MTVTGDVSLWPLPDTANTVTGHCRSDMQSGKYNSEVQVKVKVILEQATKA
jgi:hypothetical protein